MGIVVDAVSDTHTINHSDIRPNPHCGGNISVQYLQGLVEIEDKLVLLLDIDSMLSDEHIEQIQQVS